MISDLESSGSLPQPQNAHASPDSAAPAHTAGDSGRIGLPSFGSPPLAALAVFVLVGGALAMLRMGASILSPLILSVFLVTLALPVYRRFRRRGIKKGVALLMLMVAMLLLGLGLSALLWLSAYRLLQGLGSDAVRIREAVGALLAQVGSGPADAAGTGAARVFVTMATSIASSIAQFVVSVVLAIFLLLEAPRLGRLLNTSMKDLPFLGLMPQVMDAAIQYFLVRMRVNALIGVLFGLFLWFMGIDHALLWGILAFMLGFVPYVGLVVAGTPAVLLALAQSGWVWALVIVLVLTLINFTVENVVTPSLTGKTLSLSPAAVLVSFMFWIWLLGAIGALIAMPLTVLLMLTFRKYDSTRWVAQLIGNQEQSPP